MIIVVIIVVMIIVVIIMGESGPLLEAPLGREHEAEEEGACDKTACHDNIYIYIYTHVYVYM